MENLTNDLFQIEEGFNLIQKEIEVFKNKIDNFNEKDFFVNCASSFYQTYYPSLDFLKTEFIKMKENVYFNFQKFS